MCELTCARGHGPGCGPPVQAHVALDTTVFPTGTTGYVLDAIVRAPMWKAGLDYRHGTGHGVGKYTEGAQ
eukprot:7550427-Pyramimonas_sp.AAC.1